MIPSPNDNSCKTLTVLFDGACPLCRREVAVYRNLTPINDGPPLQWLDVSQPQTALPAGAEQSTFLARFHVVRGDGQMLSGAAAFVALWSVLPGWRWLARLGALPGATQVLEWAYLGFLKVRPLMQRFAKAFDAPKVSREWVGDLRSDHAGELGAVWIYKGVLALSTDPGVHDFARRHRATERLHLDKIEAVLPWPQRSRLLLGWRVAGFVTGAVPAIFGPRAVYATIGAVETFVDHHYQHQIDRIESGAASRFLRDSSETDLRALLMACQADECEHRDEALALQTGQPPGWLLRTWCGVVGKGSAAAVGLARRL